MRSFVLLAALAAIPLANAAIIVDDFSGDVVSVTTDSVTDLAYASGAAPVVPGMVRNLGQLYVGLPNRAAAAVSNGTFNVSTPISANTLTALCYGDVTGPAAFGPDWFIGANDPDYGFGGNNTLRLHFLSNEQNLGLRLVLQNDLGYKVYEKMVAGSQFAPFTVDITDADVTLNGGASLSEFDTMYLSFQSSNAGDFELDMIEAVPEPASMLALALGAGLMIRRRRKA